MRLTGAVFGFFLMIMGMLGGALIPQDVVYADPPEESSSVESDNNAENNGNTNSDNDNSNSENNTEASTSDSTAATGDNCQNSLGALGWLVCPTTGKIAEAVDWLYDTIEDFLVVNPVTADDSSPIYQIWKYCLGLTNVVFIIFLLVVIYSQITGVGISNYGLKKALPKLIIAAILVNLSFLICSLAVDVSNIIGNGLRGLFDSVANSAIVANTSGSGAEVTGVSASDIAVSRAEMYGAIAGGSSIAILGIGGAIAFAPGAIWMLIPVLLGALVAVVTGLITIALRQAVVVLLIMIAPLAMVAYILPNTEEWFNKWKKLLIQMLVFYPMFSLLFGASSLAGFAIIASAQDGFGLILGTAVQIFPLFFSWKLMQMSGTFLGTINTKMRSIASAPLARNRAWADSRRQATSMKSLASGFTPYSRLAQYLSDRKIAREEETSENAAAVKSRGLAYAANRHYKRNGTPSREGEEAYARQAQMMVYERVVDRHKHNMDKGLGDLEAVKKNSSKAQKARLRALDKANVDASDYLKIEHARGEMIEYKNALGFHERMEAGVNAHFDDLHGNKDGYKLHDMSAAKRAEARARYSAASRIMEGSTEDIQFAAANAAHAYDTQKKIVETKYQKYFDYAPPTKDVEYRLEELTKMKDAANHIDAIIPGLRILNQRGDTDLVKAQLDNILNSENGVQLGTHASQALASFLMFEVKDNDPWMRRFGKYINLETARAYNKNDRKVMNVTYEEYVKGYHDGEPDYVTETNPTGRMYAKKSMQTLMAGTPLDNIERTALDNYDSSLRKAYTDENGNLDLGAYIEKRQAVDKAVAPQFISANLKYLSGSEQIGAAVKAKTGYFTKQNKETGEYYVTSIWEDEADELFKGYKTPEEKDAAKANMKDWHRKQVVQYLLDQTPSQILALRSDYHDGLREHLADTFMLNDEKELSEEELAARREYEQEVAEIQTKYGDNPMGEAKRKRDAELTEAREKLAGAEMKKLLEGRGTLEQIYRTRRSGAANAAKPWVRSWLGLDDERSIKDYEAKKRAQNEKKEPEESIQNHVVEEEDNGYQIYDENKRTEFRDYVEDLYQDMKNADDEDFYDESLKYIIDNLSEESRIAQEYQRRHRNDPYADKYNMKEWLLELLDNPDNY